MESDDPEPEGKTNVCPICGNGFDSMAGLRQHCTKRHTDEEIQAAIANKMQSIVRTSPSSLTTTFKPCLAWNKFQIIKDDSSSPSGKSYQQFDIIENNAQGDCLFWSVIEFLRDPKHNFKNVPKNINELRIMAVNHNLARKNDGLHLDFDLFKESTIVNLRHQIPGLCANDENADHDEIADQDENADPEKAFKAAYSNYMSIPGKYGTTGELCAIAEMYDFSFYVIRENDPNNYTCYDYGSIRNVSEMPILHLLFTGNVDKGHFRLLHPTDEKLCSRIALGNYMIASKYTSSKMISVAQVSQNAGTTTNDQSEKYEAENSDTPGFICDICKRPFETLRGMKVHRSQHKDEPNVNSEQDDNEETPETSFKDFVLLLARCRKNIRVLKRVPRGARISAANKLTKCIEECLVQPHLEKKWKNLLTFAYATLRVPEKINNKSLSSLVKQNIEKSELIFPKPSKKRIQISISKRVEYKIAEGNVKGAVKLLSSTDTLAPQNEATFRQLQQKHPPPSRKMCFPDPPDKDIQPLVVSEKEVYLSIKSFPNGSAAGIDGLLPQHLKDLTLPSTGEVGLKLLKAVTRLSNFMLQGKIDSRLTEIMYGASLCALNKEVGGIRPIAVGNTFRRLTAKLSCASVRSKMSSKFAPRQVGYGIRGGCEAAAHATRTFIKKNSHRKAVVLKIDFRNAFNEVDRDKFLNEMRMNCPAIYPFLWQCYSTSTLLFYGDYILLSQNGAQQGDPCGPLLFSSAIQSVVAALLSEFIIFYLDDGTIAGEYDSVIRDFKTVIEECGKIGLKINPAKCEIYFCSEVDQDTVNRFEELSPGICVVNELTLLGAPISDNASRKVFRKKLKELKLLFKRLVELDNYHIAFYILKNCYSMPKLIFLLRTSPIWKYNDFMEDFDTHIKSTLESLTNCKLDNDTWTLASLPVNYGGLGVRRVQDTALPAFLSSINASSSLVSIMLNLPALNIEEIADYQDGLNTWNRLHPEIDQPEIPTSQKQWSLTTVTRLFKEMHFEESGEKARFLAIQGSESGAWLHALPSKPIGTLLNNNTFRISVGLRLGSDICMPHLCRCGSLVDKKGRHGLKCRLSAGRHARHGELNITIKRAVVLADFPAVLEPVGLTRDDGKRVDGMTLTQWSRGSSLIWDATCTDTFAPSNLRFSTKRAGGAADDKAQRKRAKYSSLIDQNYSFVPFAVETMGSWGTEAIAFFEELGKRITLKTNEPRSKAFLKQRLSIAIQRGNAAAVMGTFRPSDKMDEIYYIL